MTASEIPASLDDLQQQPAAGSPGEGATGVLASIRAVETTGQDERKGKVLRAIHDLAESGQMDDEVTKLTVKDYVVTKGLLKAGEFNAVVRQVNTGREAAAKAERKAGGEPDEQEIAEAFLALGGDLTGAEVLDLVAGFIGPYLALPSEHCLTVMVLWAAHSHAAHRFYVTPRLVFDSAEYGSGKTRALEVLFLVCFRPKMTISTTTAALYRRLAKAGERPLTILFDETDAMFNPRTAPQYEDLRAVLNAGYKRGATVDRCVGDGASMDVAEFPVFAPVALAGIAGYTPRSIRDRSVAEIHMRKRLPTETVRSFEEEEAAEESAPVRDALGGWVASVSDSLGTARPVMPDGVTDRRAENWRALLAVADAAGADWPERARDACRYFVLGGENKDTFGTRLLRDIRHVFTTWNVIPATGEDEDPVRMPAGFTEVLATTDIIEKLIALEDSPWRDLKGKPLDPLRLKDELGRYQVDKLPIRIPDLDKPPGKDGRMRTKSSKGYRVSGDGGLGDAWARYLPDHETYLTSASSGDSGDSGDGRPPDFEGQVPSGLSGDSGDSGDAAGQGDLLADHSGDTNRTAVTLQVRPGSTGDTAGQEGGDTAAAGQAVTAVSAGPLSVTAGSKPSTSNVTDVTAVTAMGGQHLSPAVALLERELGAKPIEPSANGQHGPACCEKCGDAYDGPVHAITCRGYDPAA